MQSRRPVSPVSPVEESIMNRPWLQLMLATSLVTMVVVGEAPGQFVKIDDFETYSVGDLDSQGSWLADPGIEVILEPGTSNHVLNADGGAFNAVASNDDPNLEIAEGSVSTLFFRFQRGFNNHVIWGMSAVDGPTEWGDFETGIGVRWQDGRSDGPLDVRDGGTYTEVADIPEEEWFNVWMVMDNDHDEWEAYAQSEVTFPEQTLLDDGVDSLFLFRNGTTESLSTFFLRVGADFHHDQFLLDDLYIDRQGENLQLPLFQQQPRLQAGDADQDLDFDQLDLVQVQIAAKYLTGQVATWGEGDWNGAPGGTPGSPPQGNGTFDQLDIIAALAPGHYLTGPYAAAGGAGDAGEGQLASIPEPATLLLLAVGVLGIGLARRPRGSRGARANRSTGHV
jgi:hypothetical protein